MGAAPLEIFKTQKEAEIYLEGIKTGLEFKNVDIERFIIFDDTETPGLEGWSVNID